MRRILNFWRLRRFDDDWIVVEYYRTRRGVVITRLLANT